MAAAKTYLLGAGGTRDDIGGVTSARRGMHGSTESGYHERGRGVGFWGVVSTLERGAKKIFAVSTVVSYRGRLTVSEQFYQKARQRQEEAGRARQRGRRGGS